MNQNILSTDQSKKMALTRNQKKTEEIVSPKKCTLDVKSIIFTYEWTQRIKWTSTNPFDNFNSFDFTDLKMEKQFTNDYHHCGANKKITDVINKRNKSPETLQLVENQQELTKARNLWFQFHANFNREVWVPRRLDHWRRHEVASIELDLLLGTMGRTDGANENLNLFNRGQARAQRRKNKSSKMCREPKKWRGTANGKLPYSRLEKTW